MLDRLLGIRGITMIIQRNAATDAERQIHLRRLVVFRHVRIKVIFPIPLRNRRSRAAEQHACQHRFFNRYPIQHRQRPGQTKASRANVHIRLITKRRGTSTKHLRARIDLAMNFEADGDEIHGE